MQGFASLHLVRSMAVPVIIATLAAAAYAVPAPDHQSNEASAVADKYPGKLLQLLSSSLYRDVKCRGS